MDVAADLLGIRREDPWLFVLESLGVILYSQAPSIRAQCSYVAASVGTSDRGATASLIRVF
jgi:hypothetical protein